MQMRSVKNTKTGSTIVCSREIRSEIIVFMVKRRVNELYANDIMHSYGACARQVRLLRD